MQQHNVPLPNSTHTLPAGSLIQRRTSPHQWIEVTLGVARKQKLPSLATMENQKPRDRKYLTRDQLEETYGADTDAVDRITAYAHQHNLQVTRMEPGAARMRLAGTVEDISAAFGVSLFDYKHATLGEFHAHTGPVSVPAELAGAVTGVFGFNNHRHLRRNKATPVTVLTPVSAAAASTPRYFLPPELGTLYDFPDATGKGQCIGLLEFGGGVDTKSATEYFKKLGIAEPNITSVSVDNVTTDPTADPDSTQEVMLDIDVAGSLAPDANIVVYFSTFDEKGLIDAISAVIADKANDPSVVSISWGSGREPAISKFHPVDSGGDRPHRRELPGGGATGHHGLRFNRRRRFRSAGQGRARARELSGNRRERARGWRHHAAQESGKDSGHRE